MAAGRPREAEEVIEGAAPLMRRASLSLADSLEALDKRIAAEGGADWKTLALWVDRARPRAQGRAGQGDAREPEGQDRAREAQGALRQDSCAAHAQGQDT